LSQEQFLAMMAELLTAGLDTTANSTALILNLLSERRDLRQALIEEPTLIPSAIEEFLRYLTPLPILSRTTTRTIEIDTVEIQEGDKVQLNWLSANHDPAEFPDPEEIQLDRSPNRHFAFGTGPHRCLGSHLARIELKVVLEEVLQRLPDYEINGAGVVRYAGITRGIAALPATFSPGPRIGQ
jgi:cytochrome P450